MKIPVGIRVVKELRVPDIKQKYCIKPTFRLIWGNYWIPAINSQLMEMVIYSFVGAILSLNQLRVRFSSVPCHLTF